MSKPKKANRLGCVVKDGVILCGNRHAGVSKNTPKFTSSGAAKATANRVGGKRLTVMSMILIDDDFVFYFYDHDNGLSRGIK